jgi:ADP-ribose pyrophosphatase
MDYDYQILDSETLADSFLRLKRYRLRHSLFAGGLSNELVRERVEGYRAAALLPYDPVRDEVVLIEQFRIGALEDRGGAWILEVAGGILEGDQDQDPELVARRETMEEAGCEVTALEFICEFMVSPGTTTERIHLYCGRVDASKAAGIHGVHEEGEDIRVQVLTADDAIAELYTGRINSTAIIIAMQWLALHRDELRKRWLADKA